MISFVAQTQGLHLVRAQTTGAIQEALLNDRPALIFWNTDDERLGPVQFEALSNAKFPSSRVFALTQAEISDDSWLGVILSEQSRQGIPPPFSHQIWRRYMEPMPFLIARLASFALQSEKPSPSSAPALIRFFADGSWNQKLQIVRSSHKKAAVGALEKVLTEKNVPKRLATLVATAADELLLNAIYEAPVARGTAPGAKELRYQRVFDRNKDLELNDREKVSLVLAASPTHMGVMVRDQWGSIPKEALEKILWAGPSASDEKAPSRLGLSSVAGAGISLHVHCVPEILTEVTLLIPICSTFRDFRSGFRFSSVVRP